MSFSGNVKEELVNVHSSSRHCQIAEIAAIIEFCGKIAEEEGRIRIRIQTENKTVARKYFTLLRKAFNIYSDVLVRLNGRQGKNFIYVLEVAGHKDAEGILKSIKHRDGTISPLLLKNSCCKRAFLRGAYLAAGSMSAPEKGYHLEYVCTKETQAEQLVAILKDFSLDGKIVLRKKYFVVYLKEGEGIVDLLNIMEAHRALMDLENLRILKEVRNSVNRRVNCEAANITKTVNAASRQVEDILFIKERYGLKKLPENLQEMAQVRLENPDAALKELGELLDPPVGKSGVNHRLRKLAEIAKRLKAQEEEKL
ncbi:MAG: DNA-binding protein WhiA [Lachnospiraceae bacterium]|nr:DNA-binding protein WhiA [Lachnospiraceae bacterium]